MSVCVNQKDLQPTEYDGSIPMFMEKKPPSDDMLQSFDLVRVSILPKNDDGLKKDKKACFSFKSVGSTMRTLSSVLAHLRVTMAKSKEDAEEDAIQLIRGEGKYVGEKGKVLPYAHQVDSMPPKDNKEVSCFPLLRSMAMGHMLLRRIRDVCVRLQPSRESGLRIIRGHHLRVPHGVHHPRHHVHV